MLGAFPLDHADQRVFFNALCHVPDVGPGMGQPLAKHFKSLGNLMSRLNDPARQGLCYASCPALHFKLPKTGLDAVAWRHVLRQHVGLTPCTCETASCKMTVTCHL